MLWKSFWPSALSALVLFVLLWLKGDLDAVAIAKVAVSFGCGAWALLVIVRWLNARIG